MPKKKYVHVRLVDGGQSLVQIIALSQTQVQCTIGCPNFFLEFCNLFCTRAAYSYGEPPQKFSSLKTNQKKKPALFQIIALSQTQMHCTHLLPNMSLIFSKIGKRSRICVRSPLPPNIFIPFFLFFLRLRSSESELMFAIRFQRCVQCSF